MEKAVMKPRRMRTPSMNTVNSWSDNQPQGKPKEVQPVINSPKSHNRADGLSAPNRGQGLYAHRQGLNQVPVPPRTHPVNMDPNLNTAPRTTRSYAQQDTGTMSRQGIPEQRPTAQRPTARPESRRNLNERGRSRPELRQEPGPRPMERPQLRQNPNGRPMSERSQLYRNPAQGSNGRQTMRQETDTLTRPPLRNSRQNPAERQPERQSERQFERQPGRKPERQPVRQDLRQDLRQELRQESESRPVRPQLRQNPGTRQQARPELRQESESRQKTQGRKAVPSPAQEQRLQSRSPVKQIPGRESLPATQKESKASPMKKSEPMARVIPVVNARMTPVPVHAVPPKSVSEESFFKRVRWTTFPWLSKKVVVTFFATFLALAGGIIYLNMTVPVVNIIVSDKQFGYTASLNEAREIFYDALHTLGEEKIDNDSIMTDEKVFFLPQRVDKKTYEENQASVDDIAQYINAYFPGFGIQVDGIDSGIVVATKEEAEEILTELRKYYETLSDDKIELVENNVYSVDYEEDVVVVDTQAQPLYIKSKKDALKDLIEGKLVSKTYEVVDEGVTVEDIAQTYKITAESILDANKDLGSAEDELALGSSVKVFVVEPYLTVIVSGLRVAKEEIEFEIETRKDPKLLVNATKVSQEGIPGSKDITFTFVSRNGIIDMDDENGYSVLSEAVTLEPVSRIILEGTGSTQLASAGSAVKISQGTGELPTLKWPTSGTITSRYRTPSRPNHNGIDIANPVGTPIYAASSGVVIFRGWATGYGNCVVIDHGNGVGTRYGHLSTFNVSAGDEVAWGQIIAGMGNTGNSTGPHLHFEVFLNTTGTQYYINPESAPYADH